MRSNLAKLLAAASALTMAAPAMAHIVGASYDFSTSVTGSTEIGSTPGTYTDPANPGFCVGPPVACSSGSGMFGFFSFADPLPNTGLITFTFFGSTDSAPGSFTIDLGHFVTTDHEKITNVTYSSGNLFEGDFSAVSWNGTDALFTGSTTGAYNAVGGTSVVFDVALTTVPEPATWVLVGLGFALLGFAGYRKTKGAAHFAA
jgi:PEP-CTERM motif